MADRYVRFLGLGRGESRLLTDSNAGKLLIVVVHYMPSGVIFLGRCVGAIFTMGGGISCVGGALCK